MADRVIAIGKIASPQPNVAAARLGHASRHGDERRSAYGERGGAGLEGVGKSLGHKDPKTIQRYAHVNDDYWQDVMGAHRRR